MKNALIKRSGVLILLFVVAIGITLATFFYQAEGPFMDDCGNLCGTEKVPQYCIRFVLQAGWPMPYYFDNPSDSVPDALSLEDYPNFGFFALDVWFFASILLLIWQLFAKRE